MPILKILAHIQTIANTEAIPIPIERMICHIGTISVDAVTLIIMVKGSSGGVKLEMTATRPLGCSEMIGQRANGLNKRSITGPKRDCASLNSLTALPIAAIMVATIK